MTIERKKFCESLKIKATNIQEKKERERKKEIFRFSKKLKEKLIQMTARRSSLESEEDRLFFFHVFFFCLELASSSNRKTQCR